MHVWVENQPFAWNFNWEKNIKSWWSEIDTTGLKRNWNSVSLLFVLSDINKIEISPSEIFLVKLWNF